MSPLVYILIVNYNGRRWLEDCFKALLATEYGNFKVLFIDNDSADDSVEFVKTNFPEIEVIANPSNAGFYTANNIGISRALEARADYVVLLNGDTKVTKDWLTELITVGEQNPDIGVLGPVQMAYSDTGFNYWTTTIAK